MEAPVSHSDTHHLKSLSALIRQSLASTIMLKRGFPAVSNLSSPLPLTSIDATKPCIVSPSFREDRRSTASSRRVTGMVVGGSKMLSRASGWAVPIVRIPKGQWTRTKSLRSKIPVEGLLESKSDSRDASVGRENLRRLSRQMSGFLDWPYVKEHTKIIEFSGMQLGWDVLSSLFEMPHRWLLDNFCCHCRGGLIEGCHQPVAHFIKR